MFFEYKYETSTRKIYDCKTCLGIGTNVVELEMLRIYIEFDVVLV